MCMFASKIQASGELRLSDIEASHHSNSVASGKPLLSMCVCVCVRVCVCLISSRLRQGVLALTGLLNISGPTVDIAGRETPAAHVINVATQCSCLKPLRVCMCVSLYAFHLTSMSLFVNECVCGWMVVFLVHGGTGSCWLDCDWTELFLLREGEKKRQRDKWEMNAMMERKEEEDLRF